MGVQEVKKEERINMQKRQLNINETRINIAYHKNTNYSA
jgi:hypothetical protein